jgi:D-alanyl-D-alanine carboxypeptidase (penicillin-binding protein 5/6)
MQHDPGGGSVRRPARRPIAAATAAALIGLAGLAATRACTAAAAVQHGTASAAAGGSVAHSAAAGRPARQEVGGPLLAGHGIVVRYPAGAHRRLPKVPASAYVLADADNDDVLAAKDAHGEFPPASTLKVLTAITLIPLLNPNATVAATRRATSVVPNVVGLIRGRRYKVSDLFRALLLISANDAAVALAQATGSFARGMALINAEAHHLQAYDVDAKQPNGLPAPGQQASAYDLALIARQALRMPAFMKYDSTLAARFPVKPRRKVTLVNQNYLLTGYRGAIGGKIGWTERARATYIGMARRHGVTLIVTLLHCKPLHEITAGERLLNWGFAMAGKVRPVGVLVPPLRGGSGGSVQTPASAGAGRSPASGGRRRGPGHAASAPARKPSGVPVAPLVIGAVIVALVALAYGLVIRAGRSPG